MPEEKEEVSKPTEVSSGGAVTSEEKLLAAIGYLGILFLVPLLAKKESKFCQFHAKQGLVLFIADVILYFVGWIPFLGWVILAVGGIFVLILVIMGIINAANGKYWEMPVLGQYAKKFNF